MLLVFGMLAASLYAEDSLPVVEVKGDRTMIYPQRMDLTGEETLMDILQMVPDLMVGGFEYVIDDYNLRVDNCPMNGDVRLILSQMKAKDVAKIQVCDNTGVAKGTVGLGNVLDINMLMPDTVKGFVEGLGLHGAGTIGMAAATFGLIAGSMLGGPLAEFIIRKKLTHEQMQPQDDEIDPAMAGIESDEASASVPPPTRWQT